MKKIMKFLRIIAIVCLIVITMTTSTFASPQINIVSSEEAIDLAMFYYCHNATDDKLITVDNYAVTPLYDENEKITYYCVDLFYNGEGIGYVVIGGNLNYIQCPELSLEETSIYYLNALEGKKTVYYNPIEIFMPTSDKTIYLNMANQETEKESIDGNIIDGNLIENRGLLRSVTDTDNPLYERDSFSEHPSQYLESLGFTNIGFTTYGTLEPQMEQAGAFNFMYDIPENGLLLSNLTLLFNSGHCSITAVSNILMYWRYKLNSTSIPSSYYEIFSDVCNKASQMGYFSKTATDRGVKFGNVRRFTVEVIRDYGYSSIHETVEEADWDFLTESIGMGCPLYLRFGHDPADGETEFAYSYHATVAFGYNIMYGTRNWTQYTYKFVKLFDGWDVYYGTPSTGRRYVCWDALETSQLDFEIDQNGEIIDHSINVGMYRVFLTGGGTLE